ncbi:MAG: hypothetical protein OHK0046_36000 [Anaerolineae bacterium]
MRAAANIHIAEAEPRNGAQRFRKRQVVKSPGMASELGSHQWSVFSLSLSVIRRGTVGHSTAVPLQVMYGGTAAGLPIASLRGPTKPSPGPG